MIALCPSCHDAAHHGQLKTTDEALYRWKGLERPVAQKSAHIYVEPASKPSEIKLLTGSVCVASTNAQATVFELSNTNHLKFRVLDQDILQVNVRLQDQHGIELLRVIENHVRANRDVDLSYEYQAGHIRVTVPTTSDFVTRWVIDQVRVQDETFAADGRIVALDLEVLKPGLLRVQGFWPDGDVGIVITEKALFFCNQSAQGPIAIVGAGVDSVYRYTGPITKASFGFGLNPGRPQTRSTKVGPVPRA